MNRREFLKTLAVLPLTALAKTSSRGYYVDPKVASYWIKKEGNTVQCQNCPHKCVLKDGQRGFCRVRENRGGKLYTLSYGNPCAVHIDPIEKKPLYHFLPGTTAYSIATAGCNFRCKHCQNYQISQVAPEETSNYKLPPEKLVNEVLHHKNRNNISSIAYTYTEPSIFIEYMLDSAKLAKKEGIKNVYHSNGYLNEKPLLDLIPFLDGANIDLKFFKNDSYMDIASGSLEPVLNTLKKLKAGGVWLEITYLIIPTINDDTKEIKEMTSWVLDNLGDEVPIHFSRFYPTYKLENLPQTPLKSVEKAREIAIDMGVKYSFVGNVPSGNPGENTYCPACGKLLIKRRGYYILENNIKKDSCPACGEKIAGVWK
ncbi:AmmeMemoRadiSam system radical SAM enzyme [candidate division WOR-3 bacterium]|nr:AmmeMemoRadiSam system radical SAM enzyme [candidate division WOR-3 bacterium]